MGGTPCKRPQNEHVQGAQKQIRTRLLVLFHSRPSTLIEKAIVDGRLWIVKSMFCRMTSNDDFRATHSSTSCARTIG
jgi:hypothetical protein